MQEKKNKTEYKLDDFSHSRCFFLWQKTLFKDYLCFLLVRERATGFYLFRTYYDRKLFDVDIFSKYKLIRNLSNLNLDDKIPNLFLCIW